MKNITVVGYLANWRETCRGCVVDEGDSQFELAHTTDPAQATELAANMIARGEIEETAAWTVTILLNGLPLVGEEADYYGVGVSDEDREFANSIFDKALVMSMDMIEAHREKKAERAREIARREAELVRERELVQLEELKKKYGTTWTR